MQYARDAVHGGVVSSSGVESGWRSAGEDEGVGNVGGALADERVGVARGDAEDARELDKVALGCDNNEKRGDQHEHGGHFV